MKCNSSAKENIFLAFVPYFFCMICVVDFLDDMYTYTLYMYLHWTYVLYTESSAPDILLSSEFIAVVQ